MCLSYLFFILWALKAWTSAMWLENCISQFSVNDELISALTSVSYSYRPAKVTGFKTKWNGWGVH